MRRALLLLALGVGLAVAVIHFGPARAVPACPGQVCHLGADCPDDDFCGACRCIEGRCAH